MLLISSNIYKVKKIYLKMVKGRTLRNLVLGTALVGSLVGGGNLDAAVTGRLDIINYTYNDYTSGLEKNLQKDGTSLGKDSDDRIYSPIFNSSGIISKIVSTIPGYELQSDYRPFSNNTPTYLKTSLHSQNGYSIIVSNLKNDIILNLDPNNQGYTFGSQPIYLMKTDTAGNAFGNLYNVKNLTNNPSKTGTINLSNLNGTYLSQVPYGGLNLEFGDLIVDKGTLNIMNYDDITPGDNVIIGNGGHIILNSGLSHAISLGGLTITSGAGSSGSGSGYSNLPNLESIVSTPPASVIASATSTPEPSDWMLTGVALGIGAMAAGAVYSDRKRKQKLRMGNRLEQRKIM